MLLFEKTIGSNKLHNSTSFYSTLSGHDISASSTLYVHTVIFPEDNHCIYDSDV